MFRNDNKIYIYFTPDVGKLSDCMINIYIGTGKISSVPKT